MPGSDSAESVVGPGLSRYVQDVAKVMVPLLKFFCWEDVRMAAVNTLEPLLRSAKVATQKQVRLSGNFGRGRATENPLVL